MDFGVNTTPKDVFAALQARIATALGIETNYVVLSMWDIDQILDAISIDFFVLLKPGRFPAIMPITDGMSPESKAYDGQVAIQIWTKLNTDVDGWDLNYLQTATLGAFSHLDALLNSTTGMEQFTPLDNDGKCILKEPMRNVNFTCMTRKAGKQWGVIETNWSVQFCYDVI